MSILFIIITDNYMYTKYKFNEWWKYHSATDAY
jgi:hypothetical protein